MILVGILDTTGLGHCPSLDSYLSLNERERIEKIKNPDRKKASLLSRIFLNKLYTDSFDEKIPEMDYKDMGKPYFKNSSVAFSISHDRDLIAVAISDECDSVGVDIQSVLGDSERASRLEKRFLSGIDFSSQEELDVEVSFFYASLSGDELQIKKADKNFNQSEREEKDSFLFSWTRLEASLKLVGCGFEGIKNVNEYLQNESLKTLFLTHGCCRYALSVAAFKK